MTTHLVDPQHYERRRQDHTRALDSMPATWRGEQWTATWRVVRVSERGLDGVAVWTGAFSNTKPSERKAECVRRIAREFGIARGLLILEVCI